MRYGTPKLLALARSLDLLEAIIADAGRATTLELAARLGMPHATAHRIVRTLAAEGFVVEVSRGRHIAGARLRTLLLHVSDWQCLTGISRPILRNAAIRFNCIAHLGVLEDGMVTYLVREGVEDGSLFTREGSQLEAYCSGLGKILLANLPADERNAYLASGPFVPLTPATITDPTLVRAELDRVSQAKIAWDREEIAQGLICCAAPVEWPEGKVRVAVSLSFDDATYRSRGEAAIIRAATRLAQQVTQAATMLDTGCVPAIG